MDLYYLLGILAVATASAFIIRLVSDTSKSNYKYRYSNRKYILSRAELHFYKTLVKVLPEDISVSTKVRLLDLVKPNESGKNFTIANNKIKSKHLDFVLFNNNSGEILACIELDDKSHSSSSAKERDQIKNFVLESAGLRLLRVPASRDYDPHSLHELLAL